MGIQETVNCEHGCAKVASSSWPVTQRGERECNHPFFPSLALHCIHSTRHLPSRHLRVRAEREGTALWQPQLKDLKPVVKSASDNGLFLYWLYVYDFPCVMKTTARLFPLHCPLLDLWRWWYVPASLAMLLTSILNILSIFKKLKTDSKGLQVSLWKDDILQYIQKYSENTYDFIYKTRSQQITRITWLWIFKLSMHSWNLKKY